MKDIDTLIPAINYNSVEILQNIDSLKNKHTEINELQNKIYLLQKERRDIFNKISEDINTFKTILNKFETCYLLNTHFQNDGYKQISILDFSITYNSDYNLEAYAEKNKNFKFYKMIEYELSLDVDNFKVENEKIYCKHIFKKKSMYSLSLSNIIEILASTGYFINKEEFNKEYKLINEK